MVCVFDEPLTDVAVLPGDLEADLLGNTNDLRRGMVGEGIGGETVNVIVPMALEDEATARAFQLI